VLYGESPNDYFFISIYVGAPQQQEEDWLLTLTKDNLSPTSASNHTVDVSKVCTVPSWVDGVGHTFRDFYVEGKHPLKLHSPNEFRNSVVACLVDLAVKNPIKYSDTTRALDFGATYQQFFVRDDEVYIKYLTFA